MDHVGDAQCGALLTATAEVGAPIAERRVFGDVIRSDDLAGGIAGQVGQDRHAGARGLQTILRGDGERWDADHLPGGVDQRTAAMPRVIGVLV